MLGVHAGRQVRHEERLRLDAPIRHRRLPLYLGSAAYAAIAAAVSWPHSPVSGAWLPRGDLGDPVQMSWNLAWIAHAVTGAHNPFFSGALDYPYGVNMALNTSVPILGLVAAPVTLAFGPVVSFNLLIHLSLAVSAAACMWTLHRWARWPAAFAGGLLYGFGPYLAAQVQYNAHLDLAFAPFPPLIVACLDELLVTRRRSPVATGAWLGALALAQFLTAPEVLADMALLAVVPAAYLAPARRARLRELARSAAPGIALASAVFVAGAAWPAVTMLFGPGHISGTVQLVASLGKLHADVLGIFLPTRHVWIAPASLAAKAATFVDANTTENGSYLGVPLVAALAVIALRLRRLGPVRMAGVVALEAWILSLGPSLTMDGNDLRFPLPGAILEHVPLLDNVVEARFSLFTGFAAGWLLAIGLDRADEVFRWRNTRAAAGGERAGGGAPSPTGLTRRSLRLLPLAVAAVVLVPDVPHLGFDASPVPDFSALDAALAHDVPAGGVVLAYPFPSPPYDEAMLWQADDRMRFRLIGGYQIIPRPGGDGTILPPFLAPQVAQDLLWSAADPVFRIAHPLSALDTQAIAALRQYVERYAVAAVVFVPEGDEPAYAEHYLTAALGPPDVRAGQGEIWFTNRHHARSPAAGGAVPLQQSTGTTASPSPSPRSSSRSQSSSAPSRTSRG